MKSKYKIEDFINPEILNDLNDIKEHIDNLVVLNDKLKNKNSFINLDDLFFEKSTEKKSLLKQITLIQMAFFYIGCHLIGFGLSALILKLFGAF